MPFDQPPAIMAQTEIGQSKEWSSGFTNWRASNNFIFMGPSGKPMVTLNLNDGSMIFGEDYTPDAAARVFWEAISEEYRKMLRWKAEHPEER